MATPYNRLVQGASQAESFRELTLGRFVERLGSGEPVPGGGSASAIAAALGASLVGMVAQLSMNRPAYAEHAALNAEVSETAGALADQFLALADEDSATYAELSAALKLPKATDDERTARAAQVSAAARRASEVPLTCVEACLDLVAAAEALAGRSNRNAASDLHVAALLAEAAARGAAANVIVNLPLVADDDFRDRATARVRELLDEVARRAATTSERGLAGKTDAAPLPVSAE